MKEITLIVLYVDVNFQIVKTGDEERAMTCKSIKQSYASNHYYEREKICFVINLQKIYQSKKNYVKKYYMVLLKLNSFDKVKLAKANYTYHEDIHKYYIIKRKN